MQPPAIVELETRQLVGVHASMSLARDATPGLWRKFMPRRGEVAGRTDDKYISMRCYRDFGETMFAPDTEFDKWAAVTVDGSNEVPAGMSSYVLEGGLYAVFVHRGPARTFPDTMRYIFAQWLPASEYELDHREQFEILGEGYDPMDENWEEEVWIPIKPRVV